MSSSLTSRLQAVNTILTTSGESPVSSLDGMTVDVANAEAVLDEISRDVQSEGWHFNREKDVPFVPDSSKAINLPPNVAQIDLAANESSDVDVVQRGNRLYDRLSRSFTFKRTVKCDVLYILPFEELPEPARRYIAVRASRVFHDRFVGSESTHRFSQDDELRALVALRRADLQNQDLNIHTTNPLFWKMRRRY